MLSTSCLRPIPSLATILFQQFTGEMQNLRSPFIGMTPDYAAKDAALHIESVHNYAPVVEVNLGFLENSTLNVTGGQHTKRISILVIAALAVYAIALTTFAARGADDEAAPTFEIKIPSWFRDWKLISVAHEEGKLNDLRAVLGNDVAIKAYREAHIDHRSACTGNGRSGPLNCG